MCVCVCVEGGVCVKGYSTEYMLQKTVAGSVLCNVRTVPPSVNNCQEQNHPYFYVCTHAVRMFQPQLHLPWSATCHSNNSPIIQTIIISIAQKMTLLLHNLILWFSSRVKPRYYRNPTLNVIACRNVMTIIHSFYRKGRGNLSKSKEKRKKEKKKKGLSGPIYFQ